MEKIMTPERQLGIRIKEERKKRQFTQEELAEKSGFSLQHVGDIERGKANPTLSCLQKLAEVMDVAVSDFFAQSNDGEEPDEKLMRQRLVAFIGKAGKKHLAMFYTLYKGMGR